MMKDPVATSTSAPFVEGKGHVPFTIATISAGFEKGDFLVREEQGARIYFDFVSIEYNRVCLSIINVASNPPLCTRPFVTSNIYIYIQTYLSIYLPTFRYTSILHYSSKKPSTTLPTRDTRE
jgi:hypothetical protein